MFLRAVTFAGGLAGAAGLSQFPEYSQQYTQRLAGAVDELSRFVAEFDTDATEQGFTRDEALADLQQGGQMGAARAQTMGETLARYNRLSADLIALREAGPFTRAYNAGSLTDAEIATAAWSDFKPALPLTFEGAVFAGLGFFGGLGLLTGLFGLLKMLFGRRGVRA
ncbi:DUF2937 family protein [Pseudohalocynthiibacter aestuariivivens]|uniref:DUF2937 family protein n=1 Tax=Roseovarius pelagicus TaxID=2980108 RepID=A0ABY6DD61_9RHOB|nr:MULTISPECIES: DUF2937 family protein [Rhodobacterales]QIE44035.1 DUF2937 family protein [Pseudohalocynthiibacter aestuariivivens]UXX84066.1 DUF2937 family protein [Roseovarius pelagicus]